jgi:phosphohistidine phosphatase
MNSATRFVVLLRHGIAEPHGSKPDEERGLTETGRDRMREIGPAIQTLFPRAECIYTSPLKRCRQTARYVDESYGSIRTVVAEELRPDVATRVLRDFILAIPQQRFICVGHEPTLSNLMRALTKWRGGADVELKKAGLYGLRFDEGEGSAHLEWMLSPRVLRRIG